jgi:formylglycine-generating enzyme required for sulfatase activity/CheY-like chemotaxis protein
MRILLVDDDTAVIQALLAVLKTLPGHEVRVAITGEKALENAAALGGIDLLVSDVVMEPMDGFTLRDQLAGLYPQVRTIFITGYDLSDYPEQTANHQVLTKPVDAADLLAAVDREMAGPPAGETEKPLAQEAEPPTAAPPEPSAEPEPASPGPSEPAAAQPTVKMTPVAGTANPGTVRVAQAGAAGPPASHATVRVASTAKVKPVPVPSVPGAVPPGGAKASAGVPAAQPSGVRTVKATAVPPGMPAAKPVRPQSSGPPVPVPRAKAPTAVPVAAPAPSAEPVLPPEPAESSDPGELAGQAFGAYQLRRKTGQGRWGSIYAGTQVSINRPVSIEILDAGKASDDTTRERFIADARAKAQVQHPSILAVYEAGEAESRFFYAYEYVDRGTLADLKASGNRLDEATALRVLRVASEGLANLTSHHIPHQLPDAASISIGSDGQSHLANLATHAGEDQPTAEQEIQTLGRVMLGVLPAIQSLSQGLRDLLKGMVQTGPETLTTWGQVLQGIKAIEPKVIPVEAAKISAQDRAAIAAVELARKQQKRALYLSVGSVGSLLVILSVLIYYFFFLGRERNLDEQVDIPAGPFPFQAGETKNLPEFWIDKYEVTMGQYAKFVKFLEDHPTSEFDDPQQPHSKTADMHKPPDWDKYYLNARQNRPVHSTPIDLNCPVMTVDYWDAFAYAKWKGRELPTEEEWEKAARGPRGFLYPWGDEFDPKKVNSGVDFDPMHPDAKGGVDGYNFWNPVDKIKGDLSPFGVVGMAGNVREWTRSWDSAKHRPIVKGGSFKSKDVKLSERADFGSSFAPSFIDESLGFRTVTHTPPAKK